MKNKLSKIIEGLERKRTKKMINEVGGSTEWYEDVVGGAIGEFLEDLNNQMYSEFCKANHFRLDPKILKELRTHVEDELSDDIYMKYSQSSNKIIAKHYEKDGKDIVDFNW